MLQTANQVSLTPNRYVVGRRGRESYFKIGGAVEDRSEFESPGNNLQTCPAITLLPADGTALHSPNGQ